jgi:hypothetical protein
LEAVGEGRVIASAIGRRAIGRGAETLLN